MPDSERAIRLSPLAETDLESIWLYTFQTWSIKQADNYHAGIVAAFLALASGDKRGRPAASREGYFKYEVGSHVVYYRLTSAELDVIRVLHERMDPERHL